jgi:hypothetical protein
MQNAKFKMQKQGIDFPAFALWGCGWGRWPVE